jgi:hypothetical protein
MPEILQQRKIASVSVLWGKGENRMSGVLRLHTADGKPDLIMLLTEDDAFTIEVQRDEKGEFIILPDNFMPRRKNRKIRVEGAEEN